MADDVLVEQRTRILIITINRPAARNAIDAAVTSGVAAAMDQLDESRELSVGILTGAGGTFCAGMDLKAFLRGEQVALPGRGLAGFTQAPPRKPLIAAGGGLLRLPRRIPQNLAMEYALTGEFFSASDGQRFGLVNRVTPEGGALDGAIELAERITANAPLSIAATKEVIAASADWTADDMWQKQQEIMQPVFGSADAREGASAFAEKRAPVWRGE